MKPILELQHIRRGSILHDICLEMEDGEFLAVMGPSGSGKSTLLYNASGLDVPDAGKVILRGTEIGSLSDQERARVRLEKMGFVFQQMNMVPGLTLEENILLPGVQLTGRKSKAAVREKARSLMAGMGLEGLGPRMAHEVSGGQLQRACICRSLINDPVILFADEPTGALNRQAAGEVLDRLEALNRQGMSILMVTHDVRSAARCSRIIYLEDGRLCQSLRPSGLANEREQAVSRWLEKCGW